MWNEFSGAICDWDSRSWLWPFHFTLPLLFWALIITVVVMLVRYTFGWSAQPPFSKGHPPNLQLLAERYTRGEINRDEFLQKKRDIFG